MYIKIIVSAALMKPKRLKQFLVMSAAFCDDSVCVLGLGLS